VTIIQAGYLTRLVQDPSDIPQPNPPMFTPDGKNIIMQIAYIEPQTPQPLGDGQTVSFTVSWRYVMKMINSQEEKGIAQIGIAYPWDPRRTDNAQSTPMPLASPFPELVSIPQ